MPSVYVASDAAAYERTMGRWSRRLAKLFIDFAAIGVARKVLDVGCGTGSLTFALRDALSQASITGVDFGQAYIDFARSKASDPRVIFEQGDATAMRYADQEFDAVLSLLVLNFVPDAERAAAEMARVTKPNGVVAASVWDLRGGATFLRILADTAAVLDPSGETFRAKVFSGPFTRPGELAAAWSKVGLRNVEQTALTIRAEFQSFDDYWEPWLGGQGTVGAYVMGLSEPKRQVLERYVRLAYLAGGEDGPRSFAATAWAVRGLR